MNRKTYLTARNLLLGRKHNEKEITEHLKRIFPDQSQQELDLCYLTAMQDIRTINIITDYSSKDFC